MAQLIVSISGIRGLVGDGLGPEEAFRFGRAYGTHLGGGVVVLGRDSRPSGPMLAEALRAGLAAAGAARSIAASSRRRAWASWSGTLRRRAGRSSPPATTRCRTTASS